jgi:CheY-like chemotaxis protein
MAVILVIDDEILMRRMVQRILVPEGHVVLEAENGAVGIDMVGSHAPDIVITDILMPEKEGLETIREIRRLKSGIKVIAMSGRGTTEDAPVLQWAERLGADATLAKPFRAAELHGAINRLLGTAPKRE